MDAKVANEEIKKALQSFLEGLNNGFWLKLV
jgi:hypothetical protein